MGLFFILKTIKPRNMDALKLISREALMAIVVMDCEEIVVGNKSREEIESEVRESLKKREQPSQSNQSQPKTEFTLSPTTTEEDMNMLSKAVAEALVERGPGHTLGYVNIQTVAMHAGLLVIPMEILGLNPKQMATNMMPKDFGKTFDELMGEDGNGSPEQS